MLPLVPPAELLATVISPPCVGSAAAAPTQHSPPTATNLAHEEPVPNGTSMYTVSSVLSTTSAVISSTLSSVISVQDMVEVWGGRTPGLSPGLVAGVRDRRRESKTKSRRC